MSIIKIEQILQPYVIGAVFGAVGLFSTGFIKIFFAGLERRRKHKLNVAIEVHKIVNEASTGNFTVKPRSMEHVNIVMTDLDGVDKDMGEVLNRFVSLWVQITMADHKTHEDMKFIMEMRTEIEEKRKILVERSNKVRAD